MPRKWKRATCSPRSASCPELRPTSASRSGPTRARSESSARPAAPESTTSISSPCRARGGSAEPPGGQCGRLEPGAVVGGGVRLLLNARVDIGQLVERAADDQAGDDQV